MRVRGLSVVFLPLSLALSLGACETRTSDKDIAKESVILSLADVRQLMNDREAGEEHAVLLIDPRAPKYYADGHLPGARNLRLPDVPEDATRDPALERFARLVVYGDNPGSAVARAMFKRLLAIGYSGVRFYAGGVHDWKTSGYALESSEPPPTDEDAEEPAPATGEGS